MKRNSTLVDRKAPTTYLYFISITISSLPAPCCHFGWEMVGLRNSLIQFFKLSTQVHTNSPLPPTLCASAFESLHGEVGDSGGNAFTMELQAGEKNDNK